MLDHRFAELAKGQNFAAFTTLFPGGRPQTSVMWVDADDECALINTEVGRQKYRNILRDPRVGLVVWNASSPYHYAELRGEVVDMIHGSVAEDHIHELSRKYTGGPYTAEIETERVLLRITPMRIRAQGYPDFD